MKKALLLLIPVGILFSSCSCSDSGGKDDGGGGGEDIPIVDPEELIHATAISGDPTHPFYLKVGEQKKIKATLSPSPTLDTEKTFTWTNSNSNAVVYTAGEKSNEITLLGKKAGKSTLVATNEFNPLLKREFNVEVIDYDEESMYLWQYDSEDRKQFGYDSKENKLGNLEGTAVLNGMEWKFTRSNLSSLQSSGGAIGFGKGSAPETHVHLENINYRPIKSIVIEAASAKSQGKLTLKVGETEVLSNYTIPETDYNDHIRTIRADNLDFLQGNISIDFDTPEYDPSKTEDPTYRAPGAVQLKSIWIQYGEDTNEYVNTETFDFEEMMKDEDFLSRLKSSMTPLTIESEDSEYVIEFAAARKPGKDDKIQDLLLANSDIRITTKNPDRRLGKVEFDSQLGGSKSKYALSSSILGGEPYTTSLAKVTDGQLKYSIFAPYVDSVKFSNSNSYSSGIRKITVKSVAGKHATLSSIEEITGDPAVKEYHVGGTFNPNGLNSVVAHFEEEDVNDILVPANLFTWYDGTSYPEELTTELQVGTTSVVGVYKGKEVHVEGIEVKDFDHLEVEINEEKFNGNYLETQFFKKDGLKVFAVAGNAEKLDITSKVTFYDGATYDTEKSKSLTKESTFAKCEYINDAGEKLTCDVKIKVYEIDKLDVKNNVPTTSKYIEGSKFKSTGLEIYGSKEGVDVEPISIASKMAWNGGNALEAGQTEVIGEYNGLEVTIPNIVVAEITHVKAEGTMAISNYIEGDAFNPKGISINGYADDESITPRSVKDDCRFYDGSTYHVETEDFKQTNLTLASTYVVCEWNGVKQFNIDGIRVLPVHECSVTKAPTKLVYAEGDLFSTKDMEIAGISEDGSASKKLTNTDFTFYDANKYDPEKIAEINSSGASESAKKKAIDEMRYLAANTTSVIGINKNCPTLQVTFEGITVYAIEHLELRKIDETRDLYPLEYLEEHKFNSENIKVFGVYPVESGLKDKEFSSSNIRFYDGQSYKTEKPSTELQKGTNKVVVVDTENRYAKGLTLEIDDIVVYGVDKVRVDKTEMIVDYLHYAALQSTKSGLKFYGYNSEHPGLGEIEIANSKFVLYDGPSFGTEKQTKNLNLDTTYMVAVPAKDCKYDLKPFEIDGIVVHPITHFTVPGDLVENFAEDDTFPTTGLVITAFGESEDYGSVQLSSNYYEVFNGGFDKAKYLAGETQDKALSPKTPQLAYFVYKGGEIIDDVAVTANVHKFTSFTCDDSALKYKNYVEGDKFDKTGLVVVGYVDGFEDLTRTDRLSKFVWKYCDANGDVIQTGKEGEKKDVGTMTLDTKIIKGIYKGDPSYNTADCVITIYGIDVAPTTRIDHEINDETKVYRHYVLGDEGTATGMSFYAHAESNEYKPFKLNTSPVASGFGLYTGESAIEEKHSKTLTLKTTSFTAIYKVGDTEFVDPVNVAISVHEADHLEFAKDPSEVDYKKDYYAYEGFEYKPLGVYACCPEGCEQAKRFSVSDQIKWYDGAHFDADPSDLQEALYPETTEAVGLYLNNPNLIVRAPVNILEDTISLTKVTNVAQLQAGEKYILTAYYFSVDKEMNETIYNSAFTFASGYVKNIYDESYEFGATNNNVTKGMLSAALEITYNDAGYFVITGLKGDKPVYFGIGSEGPTAPSEFNDNCKLHISIDESSGLATIFGYYVNSKGIVDENESYLAIAKSSGAPAFKFYSNVKETSSLSIYKISNN